MKVYPFGSLVPMIHSSVLSFENVVVIGDVQIAEGVSLWPGVTLRGDKGPIRIGRNSNIQDHSLVHADPDYPVEIGDNVTVGHGAILHGCQVGRHTVVGMGAIVLNGVIVGECSRIGAGAVLGAGPTFPARSLIAGSPASVLMPLSASDVQQLVSTADEYMALAAEYRANLGSGME